MSSSLGFGHSTNPFNLNPIQVACGNFHEASLTHTTSRPMPSTADGNLHQVRNVARANQDRQFWVGGLPNDIWLCVLDHLCPHCHPGPVLRPNDEFIDARELADQIQAPLQTDARVALQAMSLTCRLFRELGQKYIGHCVIRPDIKKATFLRTMHDRPDLADSVREISVTSDAGERSILGLCTGVQRLNYIITTQDTDFDEFRSNDSQNVPNVKFGDMALVGKLERLRHLSLLSPQSRMVVDLTRGRLWLETLMKAAPELQGLSLHRFVDLRLSKSRPSWPGLHLELARFPDYMGLPENRITKLHLESTWFRYRTLEELLRNFRHLRDFRFVETLPIGLGTVPGEDKTLRPVDRQDVITLLEPLKDQLEVLILAFSGCRNGQASRPLPSLAGFTVLKILSLGNNTIAPHELGKTLTENSKGFLVDILPRRSLETLQILGLKSGALNVPMRELAWRSKLGEFPNLKHVRIVGDTSYDLKDRWKGVQQAGRYHNLERLVPENYRSKARVMASTEGHKMELETRSFFQEAGVLFNTIAIIWNLDGTRYGRRVVVFVQPCLGGCGITKCEGPE